jgi:hypothetical protein
LRHPERLERQAVREIAEVALVHKRSEMSFEIEIVVEAVAGLAIGREVEQEVAIGSNGG